MNSSQPMAASEESSVGAAYVSKHGIYFMSAYLILLFSTLGYCLAVLWPGNISLAIISVKPNRGPAKESTEVDIVGTGFTEGMQVFFGDAHAMSVTRKSDNLLTVRTPDSNAGSVTIEIDSPVGEKTSLANGFSFGGQELGVAAPATSAQASSNSASVNCQKSSLPLFTWACSLRSNLRLLLIIIVVGALGSLIHVLRSFYWYVGNRNLKASWLLMYFLLPFNGAGLGLLFFLITRGLSSQPITLQSSVDGYAALAALVGMFSQQALIKLKQIADGVFAAAEKGKDAAMVSSAPKITAIDPAEGPASGGARVTIKGAGLTGVSRVTFGGLLATNMALDSDTQITAFTPAHPAGKVDVETATSIGQKSSLAGAFTYLDLTVAGVTPTSGPTAGGTTITIRGSGFGPNPCVTVGGAAAKSVSVITPNSITAVTPSASTGPADIDITTADGKTVNLPAGFTYS
jgi:IPT/TIG domain